MNSYRLLGDWISHLTSGRSVPSSCHELKFIRTVIRARESKDCLNYPKESDCVTS